MSFPFRVTAAVAFGSRVRGEATPYSDFDLLIVAEGIPPKVHRRGEEICLIKKSLSLYPVDVLLLTEREVRSNFSNHNPLFLDIAEDGRIVLDTEGFLEGLMAATRGYIKQRGIQKIHGGWLFPVEHGAASPLSKVSNKDFAQAMLTDGERDYEIGKRLVSDTYFDKAVYHFQQAVEKCVKSILISMGVFQKTHFVGKVLRDYAGRERLSEEWKRNLLEMADIAESIEPEVGLSRYPGIVNDSLWLPSEEYQQEDAAKAEEKAGKVLSVTRAFVEQWFSGQSG